MGAQRRQASGNVGVAQAKAVKDQEHGQGSKQFKMGKEMEANKQIKVGRTGEGQER